MALLFFSYSHADAEFRDQLEKHLSMLKRQGRIDAWHDRQILAGDPVHERISAYLEKADIILLLVSSDFLDSDYCYGIEVKRAVERAGKGEARVVPVILRPCDWQSAPFGRLLAAPRDGKPVSRWADRDEAWLNVVEAIKQALPPASGPDEPRRPEQARRPVTADRPRSSNLRIRKEFSDAERARFLKGAFEYMARFFENSMEELKARHPDIDGDFTRVDAQQFTAVVYRHGKAISQCQIRLNPSSRGFGSGMAFSHDLTDRQSYNENLSVEADDQALFLKAMGMRMHGERETKLSEEGAAEYYWEMFIERLQQ